MTGAPRTLKDLTEIVLAGELLPWKATELAIRPFDGFWSFNPSLHVHEGMWRCVLRCADYAMPNGSLVRGAKARPNCAQTKNAMVIFDPDEWKPVSIHPMRELDELPRNPTCASTGFEDLRLFASDTGGLQAIAASLHLVRPKQAPGGSCPPEQVLLSFDTNYNIVRATPIRGSWSNASQKNWVPFDGAESPRFLYSIERGGLFDDGGPIDRPLIPTTPAGTDMHLRNRGITEVRVMQRPLVVSAGRALPPGYDGLRGGSQLTYLGNETWLGIGHEMRFTQGRKFYWHRWYTVDSEGTLTMTSPPMKLAREGIEFAAGMVIAGERVVVSYGVDDERCRVGETSLAAVLELLAPVEVQEKSKPVVVSGSENIVLSDPKRPKREAVGVTLRAAGLVPARAPTVTPVAFKALVDAELELLDRRELVAAYRTLRDRGEEAGAWIGSLKERP